MAREAPGPASESSAVLSDRMLARLIREAADASAADLSAIEARWLRRAEANRTRQCLRPLLRGAPRQGPADDDMLAVLAPQGALADCYTAVTAHRSKLQDMLRQAPPADRIALPRARPLDDPAWKTSAADDIAEQCTGLVAALDRAVRHEDACSPFLPGRRGLRDQTSLLDLAWAVSVSARRLAVAGEPRRAIEHIFDFLRFGQDICRGGSTHAATQLMIASARIVLPDLVLLLHAPDLQAAELEALTAEGHTLMQSIEHPRLLLDGEALHFHLFSQLPLLEGPDWKPPGGFPASHVPAPVPAPASEDERDQLARQWVAAEKGLEVVEAACPTSASLRHCVHALAGVVVAARKNEPGHVAGAQTGRGSDDEAANEVRTQLLLHLTVKLQAETRYLRRYAWYAAALAAVATALRSRHALFTRSQCPVPLKEAPPLLEQPLIIGTPSAPGIHPVATFGWAHDLGKTQERAPLFDIDCNRPE